MKVIQRQRGVVRVNCLDCIDRTNAVQTFIGESKHRSNLLPQLLQLPPPPCSLFAHGLIFPYLSTLPLLPPRYWLYCSLTPFLFLLSSLCIPKAEAVLNTQLTLIMRAHNLSPYKCEQFITVFRVGDRALPMGIDIERYVNLND